jgi:hypothetical protein
MVTKDWVAIHRKHHAKCETEEDPHSPQFFGIKKVLLDGVDLYRQARRDGSITEKYGKGTPDDWLERNVYARFPEFGPTLMLFVAFALFGLWGVVIWAGQMIWIPFMAAGVVNGLGHWWGYRNVSDDTSTNLSLGASSLVAKSCTTIIMHLSSASSAAQLESISADDHDIQCLGMAKVMRGTLAGHPFDACADNDTIRRC